MGIYHQGGVVPMQLSLSSLTSPSASQPLATPSQIIWWRTYSPPVWLLNHPPSILNTTDLMGAPSSTVLSTINAAVGECGTTFKADTRRDAILVAPRARLELDQWTTDKKSGLSWMEVRRVERHVGLDDLDWGEDGVWGTLKRVVGRRQLIAWRVRRVCA